MKKQQSNRVEFDVPHQTKLKKELTEFRILINSVPPMILTLFVIAVFSMNLLANKSISLPFDWLALDCGFAVSWFVFLAMDILTKHFGPKAATQLSLLATAINLGLCALFYMVSIIPGTWGESYVPGSEAVINTALNNTFGGTWYIILGSAVAFTVSSFVNNFMNDFVGRAFKKHPDSLTAYLCRSYASTTLGQFVDNFVFAFLVSRVFFGWTLTQCVTCSFIGMAAELLCEAVFSVFGYRICERWRKNKVGEEYLCCLNAG